MSTQAPTTHPIIKWLFIGLLILFVYELYKQIKAGAASTVGGIASAVTNAAAGVANDLAGIAQTLFTNPIAFLTTLPQLILSFLSGLLSGLSLADPLTWLFSLPEYFISFLDTLFGSPSVSPAPSAAQGNAFVANDIIPTSPAATSSLPTWLTSSPTATLPVLPSLTSDLGSTLQNVVPNLPQASGSIPSDLSDFSYALPLVGGG